MPVSPTPFTGIACLETEKVAKHRVRDHSIRTGKEECPGLPSGISAISDCIRSLTLGRTTRYSQSQPYSLTSLRINGQEWLVGEGLEELASTSISVMEIE